MKALCICAAICASLLFSCNRSSPSQFEEKAQTYNTQQPEILVDSQSIRTDYVPVEEPVESPPVEDGKPSKPLTKAQLKRSEEFQDDMKKILDDALKKAEENQPEPYGRTTFSGSDDN